MLKIQNHTYYSFCLSMMQKIIFLKKHALKVKTTLALLTFLLQTLLTTGLSDFHKMVITVLTATFTISSYKN